MMSAEWRHIPGHFSLWGFCGWLAVVLALDVALEFGAFQPHRSDAAKNKQVCDQTCPDNGPLRMSRPPSRNASGHDAVAGKPTQSAIAPNGQTLNKRDQTTMRGRPKLH